MYGQIQELLVEVYLFNWLSNPMRVKVNERGREGLWYHYQQVFFLQACPILIVAHDAKFSLLLLARKTRFLRKQIQAKSLR